MAIQHLPPRTDLERPPLVELAPAPVELHLVEPLAETNDFTSNDQLFRKLAELSITFYGSVATECTGPAFSKERPLPGSYDSR